ncbi:MAG: GNAT family protein, partial [Alphaproteobacteria bacterium]|nr:GNAT family protein [Alphaproteobacteria bacterium]
VKIDVNWKHSSADLSIVIGDRSHWNSGHATSAVRAMTARAFDHLLLRKLTAGVYAINLGSLKCFERAGWRLDAIQRDQLLFDGKPVDRIVMAAFNPGDWTTKPPITPAA